MDSFPQWSPYISLATLVFLMLVGSITQIPQLVVFAGGAAFPIGLHCLKLEAQQTQDRP
ncbi:MAG: hypothetical protein ACLFWD_02995 [Anaerolineales bacterium]